MSLHLFADGPESPTCSRAGCSSAALWNVNWRNPRIHNLDRVKVWLACDEHREYLSEYLSARDFPVLVTALGVAIDRVPDEGSPDKGSPGGDPAGGGDAA